MEARALEARCGEARGAPAPARGRAGEQVGDGGGRRGPSYAYLRLPVEGARAQPRVAAHRAVAAGAGLLAARLGRRRVVGRAHGTLNAAEVIVDVGGIVGNGGHHHESKAEGLHGT